MIKKNLHNFKKIIQMSLIDLKKITKGTLLGWFWIIAKPATQIFIYWFVFSIGLRNSEAINGFPYILWLICGLLPWFYIAEIFNFSIKSYKKYSYLVTKIKFPIEIIPKFISISRLIISLILTGLVILIYLFSGGVLDIYFIQLPFIIILMYLFMTSLGMILALLSVLSKDFENLVRICTPPILFLSPILWNINNIKIPWLITLQNINPIHFIVNSYRKIFIYKEWIYSETFSLLSFLLITIIIILLSHVLFKKLRKEIPDYL